MRPSCCGRRLRGARTLPDARRGWSGAGAADKRHTQRPYARIAALSTHPSPQAGSCHEPGRRSVLPSTRRGGQISTVERGLVFQPSPTPNPSSPAILSRSGETSTPRHRGRVFRRSGPGSRRHSSGCESDEPEDAATVKSTHPRDMIGGGPIAPAPGYGSGDGRHNVTGASTGRLRPWAHWLAVMWDPSTGDGGGRPDGRDRVVRQPGEVPSTASG